MSWGYNSQRRMRTAKRMQNVSFAFFCMRASKYCGEYQLDKTVFTVELTGPAGGSLRRACSRAGVLSGVVTVCALASEEAAESFATEDFMESCCSALF